MNLHSKVRGPLPTGCIGWATRDTCTNPDQRHRPGWNSTDHHSCFPGYGQNFYCECCVEKAGFYFPDSLTSNAHDGIREYICPDCRNGAHHNRRPQ